jgi:hypothetical protein
MVRTCRAGIKCPRGVVRHCGQPAVLPLKLPHRSLTVWYCAKHYEETTLFFAVHDTGEARAPDRPHGLTP